MMREHPIENVLFSTLLLSFLLKAWPATEKNTSKLPGNTSVQISFHLISFQISTQKHRLKRTTPWNTGSLPFQKKNIAEDLHPRCMPSWGSLSTSSAIRASISRIRSLGGEDGHWIGRDVPRSPMRNPYRSPFFVSSYGIRWMQLPNNSYIRTFKSEGGATIQWIGWRFWSILRQTNHFQQEFVYSIISQMADMH